MLLTPSSARALLQALSRCLAFDASAAAMLLAASAPQPKLLQVYPVLPATARSSSPDAAQDSIPLQELRQERDADATALFSNADKTRLRDLVGSRPEQQSDSSSATPLPSRPHSAVQHPQAGGIPLALQLVTKRESYQAVCGVACMLGHVAALHGRLPRHGPPACLAPVLGACTSIESEQSMTRLHGCTGKTSITASRMRSACGAGSCPAPLASGTLSPATAHTCARLRHRLRLHATSASGPEPEA